MEPIRKISGLIIPLAVFFIFMSVKGQDKDVIPEEFFFMGNELGVGARAIGMGGAYIGVADDYAAAYWNPAGLAQIRRMEFNLGFSHNSAQADATYLDDLQSSDADYTRLNSLGFVFPVPTYRGSLVFGIGYQKVRDYDSNTEIGALYRGQDPAYLDYTFQYSIYDLFYQDRPDTMFITDISDSLYQSKSFLSEGSRNIFSLSGGLEIQKNFYIGASLNFIGGKSERFYEFKEEDIYNIYDYWYQETIDDTTYYNISDLDYWNYTQTLNDEISAVNFKIGFLYRSGKTWRVGATVTSPTTYTVKETWNWSQTEQYEYDNLLYEDGDEGEYEYRYREPYSFAFGASFKKFNLLLSGDVEFKDWSQSEFLDPPLEGLKVAALNHALKQEMNQVMKYRVGAEYFVPIVNARIRGGYFHDPSPYENQNLRPDRDYYSGGLSFLLDKQMMLDLAYVQTSYQETVSDNLLSKPVEIDKTFGKFIASLSIRF
ncbi:outer membrane protein transport protein [candidate division KSB1 bacterium]|nr:outer membrane protein transport protein [candidate division KSB1 bacterium]